LGYAVQLAVLRKTAYDCVESVIKVSGSNPQADVPNRKHFTGHAALLRLCSCFCGVENVSYLALRLPVAVRASCLPARETQEKQGEKLFLEKCLPVT
jgi:hypothetical protein